MARSSGAKVAATLSIVHKGELHTLSLGTLPDSTYQQKMLALFKEFQRDIIFNKASLYYTSSLPTD